MPSKFVLGEFFCGPGGLALGAALAKVTHSESEFTIEHGWATDYDKDSCKTYIRNILPLRPEAVVCKDIRSLKFSDLERKARINAFAFGFPCNDFSVVGKQKGMDGVYGPLYSYGVKAISHFSPEWFIAENVSGLRNSNEGNSFQTILNDLYNVGYSIYPHLYAFDEYGVPQSRNRIILIGIRKDVPVIYRVPSPDPYSHIDISCRNALENPAIQSNSHNNEKTNQSERVIKRLRHIKPGENAFTAKLPPYLQLNVRGATISQIYKRLNPDKPAYTVTGSGGGGTHMYHWKENRALTNRERARLQTFPDDFEFIGSKESVRRQIGMAVPPMGVKIIFESVLKSFAGVEYLSIPPNIETLLQPAHVDLYNRAESNAGLHIREAKELHSNAGYR